MVPMRGADGTLLGVVSVDEPESGLRPDRRGDRRARRVRGACCGRDRGGAGRRSCGSRPCGAHPAARGLGLARRPGVRGLRPRRRGQGNPGRARVRQGRGVPRDRGRRLRPRRHRRAGRPALPGSTSGSPPPISTRSSSRSSRPKGAGWSITTTASELVASGSQYRSQRNGRGPLAWNRHWLIVPLIERDGSRSGYIWVDDPADCLLPSRERLQALRTFANQATMAIRAAVDFETLNARNTELAALHGTAMRLLERHDVDSVLTSIMQSACSLVGTPHGSLALVDPETDRLRTAVKLGLLERVGPSLVARGEGVAGRVWATNSTIAIDDYGTWDGRVEGFAGVALPRDRGRAAPRRGRGRRRHRARPTPRPAGRSGRRRSRSSSASRNSPRSRSRMHASIRRCSRARSCTAASSTARPI